ncbi:MAG: hypothetical protein ACYTEQ_23815 [Planctomycetota bacterium]|jgi:hypothetical protein
MSSDAIDRVIWFGKVAQFVSAIILTPEIVGPDRFEKLERFVESQNFLRKKEDLYFAIVLAACLSLLPVYFVYTIITIELFKGSLPRPLPMFQDNPWLAPVITLFAFLSCILLMWTGLFTRWLQSFLVRFASYLRTVSLFRSVAIALGIMLFVLGTLLEIALEWPF